MKQNIFLSFLESLKIKHTLRYSNKYFNEHPHKYNLFGLSKMLSDYGIKNMGIRIENKENDLYSLEVPFIAHVGGDFVVVNDIRQENIYYSWYDKEIKTSLQEFITSWSGVVLLAEPDENSIEPNYKNNYKKELYLRFQQYSLVIGIVVVMMLAYVSNQLFYNLGITCSLLINMLGIYIGYLLVLKQLHIQSNYADKICSLFKKSDCNNILESKAANFFGIIGWSELGLGYFISNTLLLLFFPHLITYMAMINICTLPYTIWSVWYQKMKAVQWCPLCLIVQVILWNIFIINLIVGVIYFPVFSFPDMLWVGCLYFIPFLVINLFIPELAKGNRIEQITQEINSLKTNENVFKTFLKQQTHYEVDKTTSKILFGDPDSDILVTILTNPHCNPCAWMHTRAEKLLEDINQSICIQYIFSSFNKELESGAHFMIAAYFTYPPKKVKTIYKEWFEGGKNNPKEFFQRYLHVQTEEGKKEYLRHEEWKERVQLRTTPTVLVNGYQLPDNYKIEDLRYFTDLNVNIK